MKLKEIEDFSKDLKIISQTFNEVANTTKGTADTIKPIKNLVGIRRSGLGSKLITAGITCIALPEPILSDILGLTLVAAGIVISGKRETTVIDVFRETKRLMRDLQRINSDLAHSKYRLTQPKSPLILI
ncbi:MAG: hypothetical protein QW592_05510 [Candidatus Bathyarchaeia archaeon]